MSQRVYFDYNASTPLLDVVKSAMAEGVEFFGNASSVHEHGRQMRGKIEEGREAVARLVGARSADVIFTSGGTEANNLALSPGLFAKPLQASARLFVSAIEHPSVLNGMRFEKDAISVIPVTPDGVVDLAWLERALFEGVADEEIEEGIAPYSRPVLVSVMAANNETGVIQPVQEIAALVHRAGGIFHSDCVQALGKMPVTFEALGADLISLSAHKVGGPQGVGALVLKDASIVLRDPLVAGGGQELKRRGGTENFLGIVGFGAAALALHEADEASLAAVLSLREELEAGILEISPDAVVFGQGAARLPHVCLFAVPGFSAETQVIQMDLNGVSLSSGSACSSGKVDRSHVLAAMGVADDLSFAALRLSLGQGNSVADVARFLDVWRQIYERAKAAATQTKACA